MTYLEFERLCTQWQGKVCLFGAGLIGQTWAYDLAVAAGFQIDCFCDNHVPAGTTLRDGLSVIAPEELYPFGDSVLVLLTVREQYQTVIWEQLATHGITHILEMGDRFEQEFYFSLERENNPSLLKKYKMLMDDSEYLAERFKYITGCPLNLTHPTTYNEKINWLKIHAREEKYTHMVDKVTAKEYVAAIIGDKYITPTYGTWERFADIDFGRLPDQFVLKVNHDSGGIAICKDKCNFDRTAAEKKLTTALKNNYYLASREWPYKNIKPLILAEQYLADPSVPAVTSESGPRVPQGLLDYKVHCFAGEPMYIQTIGNRDYRTHAGYQTVFDFQWKAQAWSFGDYPRYQTPLPKPTVLAEMYERSKILAHGMDYIRIDWYEVQGQLKFGELTTMPNSGYYLYNEDWTREVDLYLGSLIPIAVE